MSHLCPVEHDLARYYAAQDKQAAVSELADEIAPELAKEFREDLATFEEAMGELSADQWRRIRWALNRDTALAGQLIAKHWHEYTERLADEVAPEEAQRRSER